MALQLVKQFHVSACDCFMFLIRYSDVIWARKRLKLTASRLFAQPFVQSSLLAFVRGIHRWPMGSPHKWPVTRKMFPFDDVIMSRRWVNGWQGHIKLVAAYGKTSWWRHQMETFSALLALCAGNSSVTGEFPAQRPVTRSFDVLFGLRLNKRLSKQWWGWWFETLSSPLWRHCIGN